MNFQFTSKFKNVTFILMGVGLVLFILGFLSEKSHLYVTPHSHDSIALLQKNSADPESLNYDEQLVFKEVSDGVSEEDADLLLVEYYHELPYTVEELKSKINEAAKEKEITVTYKEFSSHSNHGHADHGTHEVDHHEESHADEATTHEDHATEESHEDHSDDHAEEEHHDGNAEEASKHDDHHELVLLMYPTAEGDNHDHHEGNAEEAESGHHDAHGSSHSPIETLTHIIHDEGSFTDSHHSRSWSNLLVNGFFFFGIGLGALFFIGLQYATESGWGVVTKRILEGITAYIPVGAIFLIIVFIAGSMGWNHIWHWMDPEVSNPDSSHYDAIIANKQPFLGQPFFWIMNVVYFGAFIISARIFRKRSLQEDIEGGTKIHFKNYVFGAIFLVLFGYLSSAMSWHWIMSIDTHWFSTLFGWYCFSGIWISGIITILLMIFFLKGQGYLEFVNESHIHDLGKWLFAVSILWSYLFFSQFMLIWYADIPEEVTYYIARFTDYKYILWIVFAINLLLPLVFLMSREAKRSRQAIVIIGCVLFVTHWLDVFIMVMPGTVFDHWDIGVLEVGMFLFFVGLFIFVVLRAFTKAPLLVKNHPYLDENLHQHT